MEQSLRASWIRWLKLSCFTPFTAFISADNVLQLCSFANNPPNNADTSAAAHIAFHKLQPKPEAF